VVPAHGGHDANDGREDPLAKNGCRRRRCDPIEKLEQRLQGPACVREEELAERDGAFGQGRRLQVVERHLNAREHNPQPAKGIGRVEGIRPQLRCDSFQMRKAAGGRPSGQGEGVSE